MFGRFPIILTYQICSNYEYDRLFVHIKYVIILFLDKDNGLSVFMLARSFNVYHALLRLL